MSRSALAIAVAAGLSLVAAGCSVLLDWSAAVEADGGQTTDALDCAPVLTFHADSDGDTFGDPLTSVEACQPPTGYVADDQDCDDQDGERHPGATERCDGVDGDCNGTGDDPTFCGCADGGREGFIDHVAEPDIAGCSGGFAVPGVIGEPGAGCGRGAGDDGELPDGEGCRAIDLCAAGWHVCSSPADVSARLVAASCAGVTVVGSPPLFFATQQSSTGGAMCGAGSDDVFGCGNLGAAVDPTTCAPLDRFSGNLCVSLGAPWDCGASSATEATNITKPAPQRGGVLCCRLP